MKKHTYLLLYSLCAFCLSFSLQGQGTDDDEIQRKGSPVEKVALLQSGGLSVNTYSFPTNGYTPYEITPWQGARRFHLMGFPSGRIACIWQDASSMAILRSSYDSKAGLLKQVSLELKNSSKGLLLAACNDDRGNMYYATYTQASGGGNVELMITKVKNNGEFVSSKTYDTSIDQLDIWDISERYMGTMQYQNGHLLMMLGRRYYKGGDGLNHQGGGAFLFDSNDLSLKKNFGQTSGHSFDNYLTTNSDGGFLAIDLGDNYPRGIHLHKFPIDGSYAKHKVVYTFKTLHGTRASYADGMPSYPKYNEISNNETTYYQWSNDNGTYTELGAVSEVGDGYLVFFLGEPSPSGKSIDNSRTYAGDPRNVGFVKVKKNYEAISNAKELYLSQGIDETGGFYTFGGRWSAQENHGVTWLTKYSKADNQSARHLKVAPLANEQFLLIWQVANQGAATATYALKVNKDGKALGSVVNIGNIPLSRRDDPLVSNGKVYIASPSDTEFVLYEIVID